MGELISCVLARFSALLLMNEREITEFTNFFLPANEDDYKNKDYAGAYNELYSLLSMSKEQFEDYLYIHKIRVLAPINDFAPGQEVAVEVNDGYPVNEEISQTNDDNVEDEELLDSKEDEELSEDSATNTTEKEDEPEILQETSYDLSQDSQPLEHNNNVENVMEPSTGNIQFGNEIIYGGKQKTLGVNPIGKQSGFASVLLLSFLTGIFSGITFMVVWLIASNV